MLTAKNSSSRGKNLSNSQKFLLERQKFSLKDKISSAQKFLLERQNFHQLTKIPAWKKKNVINSQKLFKLKILSKRRKSLIPPLEFQKPQLLEAEKISPLHKNSCLKHKISSAQNSCLKDKNSPPHKIPTSMNNKICLP